MNQEMTTGVAPTPEPARPRVRPVLSLKRRILFGSICLVAVFTLQEALFRLVFPLPELEGFNRSQFTYTAKESPALREFRRIGMGHQIIRHECEPDGFSFEHHLNLYGFRGADFRLAPSKDRPRVVFVGDSFTEGVGSSGDKTIPVLFEAGQNRRGTPVEAINLGVCGAGLPEYERLIQVSLELLKPSAIFLTLFVNDLPIDHAVGEPAPTVPTYRRYHAFIPRIVYVLDRVRQGLPVYRVFVTPRRSANQAVPSPFNPLTKQPPPQGSDPEIVDAMRRGRCNTGLAWHPLGYDRMLRHDLTRDDGGAAKMLERIMEACRAHGVRLVVAYVPAAAITNPAYLEAQKRVNPEGIGSQVPIDSAVYVGQQKYLHELTRRLNVPFLDLTVPFMAAERAGQKLYWPYDTHCTPDGYQLIATLFGQYWNDGTLPEPVTVEAYQLAVREPTDSVRR